MADSPAASGERRRAIKVIPAVDIMDGKVVRLYKGDPNKKTIYGDSPAEAARRWESEGADMLHVVDLDATLGSGNNADAVRGVVDAVSIPVQVAGGLRTVRAAVDAAGAGADRIVVGTLAFSDRESLAALVRELGPQRVVVSADHLDGRIVTRGWQSNTGLDMIESVASLHREVGVTQYLLTSVGRDGTLQGPDTSYMGRACRISGDIDVIASGGISHERDVAAVRDAGAWGVILGRALYDGRITIPSAKRMARRGPPADEGEGEKEKEEGDPQRP